MPHRLSSSTASSSSSSSSMPRIFKIDRPLFKHRYDAHPSDGGASLYVHNRPITNNLPDLTLHGGPDAASPVVAVCHMLHFSQNFKIGLGDPSAADDAVRWEDMIKANVSGTRHCWAMDLPALSSGGDMARRMFVWKRTRKVAVEGMKTSGLSPRNWKLLEDVDGGGEGEGEVLAVFTSDISGGKAGALQVNVDFGGEWESMVLITCLALYERSRRR
ncbi:hypothetical protein TOPH_09267 [Tolypocladium ophioglossoides CBS 100239]|uniref:Uncharacterized protein n=1 Tax=Tolypocladium ophioglossoides (strain CBS 100239) TaxID=1163406 RepID=A0A0L0MXC2_TOLOC|nr:hypothetical protein TOPH_09267 [Tolypocladium ophioglossoides CBS 100239]